MPTRTPLALILSCSLFLAGQLACQERPAASNAFGLQTRELHLGPAKLTVEVAATPEQSATGLMFRDALPPDRGMLFVFETSRQASFWMKNTRIPLSIGFIDASGSLLEVRSMRPYDESLVKSVSDRVAYALEVNEGWFSEHHINPGTKIQGLTRR
ncbi:MAG TPA: DUF192 domain-containing protein [Chthoniobacterales bacterium]